MISRLMLRGGLSALFASVALSALAPLGVVLALSVPTAPPLERPIVDQAGVLTSNQIDTLAQQINSSRQQKNYQFGILTINSLEGTAIEDYSLQVARQWGIGDKAQNNGVLLLVAVKDHQVRIEVGRGLEADLTDLESGRIISNTIRPQFKKGDYFSGISLGVQNIAAQVEGRPSADSSSRVVTLSGQSISDLFVLALFAVFGIVPWLGAMLARTKSWWLGGIMGGGIGVAVAAFAAWAVWAVGLAVFLAMLGLILDWAVSRNYTGNTNRGITPNWWAGGPWIGGGGSGGSGGGFGGGSFGGGGASGSW